MKHFRSFAKVNLHLEVHALRADGFHELRTLFQTIDLSDEVGLERTDRPGIALEVSSEPPGPRALPTDDRNLAWRAASRFLDRFGASEREGVRIRLHKRIPAAGGLGGGSANAATVLLGLGSLWGLEPENAATSAALAELATELGADVPFFLVGGCALGTGRGDRIQPLPDQPDPPPGARPTVLLLVLPPFGLSTAEVFARAKPRRDRPTPSGVERVIAGEPVALVDRIGENDLEGPAFAIRPELAGMYTALVRSGAERVRMSGSGSALFGLFEDSAVARAAAATLPKDTACLQVSPLGRAAWRRAAGLDPSGGGS